MKLMPCADRVLRDTPAINVPMARKLISPTTNPSTTPGSEDGKWYVYAGRAATRSSAVAAMATTTLTMACARTTAATGTEEIDVLRPAHITDRVHAVVLAGGSAFGLEAASGVRRYLEHRGIGFSLGGPVVPIVPCAILYDLGIGKSNVRPTREMGEAAAAAATTDPVKQGAVGAGTGATVGKILGMGQAMKSGIGSATPGPRGSPNRRCSRSGSGW